MAQTVLTNQTAPATPVAGATTIYVDSADKHVKQKDDAGVVIDLAQAGGFPDPMTTIGDTIYRDSTNTTTRLPIGTDYKKLTSVSGEPEWSTHRLKTTVITFAMSPFTITNANDNEFFIIDTSGGAVTINVFTQLEGKVRSFKRFGANTTQLVFQNINSTIDGIGGGPIVTLQTDVTGFTAISSGPNAMLGTDYRIMSYIGNSVTQVGFGRDIA